LRIINYKFKIMKKLLFLTAIAVLTFNTSIAQEVVVVEVEETSSDVGIHFGLKAGLNMANISTTDGATNPDTRTGFNIGAVVGYDVTEKFGVQLEVVYSQQGFTEKASGADGNLTAELDYINIPVMFGFTVIDGLTLQAGPELGFNTRAKVTLDGDDYTVIEDTNTVSFGAGAGLQYELDFGLFFQARYIWGISNVLDENTSTGITLRNKVASLSVGYFFN
jgi:opacity protein-like surface antigen